MRPLVEEYDVFLANQGEDEFNTLLLSGLDVVIPLEADLDCDPHQDDEVRPTSRKSSPKTPHQSPSKDISRRRRWLRCLPFRRTQPEPPVRTDWQG
jgi:hypothetical protein